MCDNNSAILCICVSRCLHTDVISAIVACDTHTLAKHIVDASIGSQQRGWFLSLTLNGTTYNGRSYDGTDWCATAVAALPHVERKTI